MSSRGIILVPVLLSGPFEKLPWDYKKNIIFYGRK